MNGARLREMAWQGAVLACVCTAIVLAGLQAKANLEARGIARGFGYLARPAGFEIAPGVLAFSSRDTYARALVVGIVNTLRVSALAMVIGTVLGVGVATARLSRPRDARFGRSSRLLSALPRPARSWAYQLIGGR